MKQLIVACPQRVEGRYVIGGGCRGLAMSGVSLTRLVAADAAASLVRSLRSLRTRVEDAAGTQRHFEVTGAGQKTSAACVTQRL